MPHEHTVTYTTYDFDELSDKAKEAARDWWRSMEAQDPAPWDYMDDDFVECGRILGITIAKRVGSKNEFMIHWSGFSSQGDGACFEGSYAYVKDSRHAIRKHAPKDTALHHIADALQRLQSKFFYQLTATVKHRGRYNHEYCTLIDVSASDNIGTVKFLEAEKILSELLRDFMRWMYRQLDKENDWRNADEQVDENIRANGYEFTEEGKISGP